MCFFKNSYSNWLGGIKNDLQTFHKNYWYKFFVFWFKELNGMAQQKTQKIPFKIKKFTKTTGRKITNTTIKRTK